MPFISAALRTQQSIDSGEPFKFLLDINEEQQEVFLTKDGHHYVIKYGDKILRQSKNFNRLWRIFVGGKIVNPNTINIHSFRELTIPTHYQLSQNRFTASYVGKVKLAEQINHRKRVGEWDYGHTPDSIQQIDSSRKRSMLGAYNDDAYNELAFRGDGEATTDMEFIKRLNEFDAERVSRYEKARKVIRKKKKEIELKKSIEDKAKRNKRAYGQSDINIGGNVSLGMYFKTNPKPFNPKKVRYFMVARIWHGTVTLVEFGTGNETNTNYNDMLNPMISRGSLIQCEPPVIPGGKITTLTTASIGDIFRWTGGSKHYEIIEITENDVILYKPQGTSMMPKAMATGDLLKGFERGYLSKVALEPA